MLSSSFYQAQRYNYFLKRQNKQLHFIKNSRECEMLRLPRFNRVLHEFNIHRTCEDNEEAARENKHVARLNEKAPK